MDTLRALELLLLVAGGCASMTFTAGAIWAALRHSLRTLHGTAEYHSAVLKAHNLTDANGPYSRPRQPGHDTGT